VYPLLRQAIEEKYGVPYKTVAYSALMHQARSLLILNHLQEPVSSIKTNVAAIGSAMVVLFTAITHIQELICRKSALQAQASTV